MKKILNKILDEINKEVPRLDYIRGLIEASVEEDETTIKVYKDVVITKPEFIKSDEEIIPEVAQIGPIGKIT